MEAKMQGKIQSMSIKKIDIKEFIELGILHELNRQFLHPLGLALEVRTNEDGTKCFGGVWDYRDDAEGMLFSTLNKERIEIFRQFQSKQHLRRKAELGFVVQEKDI